MARTSTLRNVADNRPLHPSQVSLYSSNNLDFGAYKSYGIWRQWRVSACSIERADRGLMSSCWFSQRKTYFLHSELRARPGAVCFTRQTFLGTRRPRQHHCPFRLLWSYTLPAAERVRMSYLELIESECCGSPFHGPCTSRRSAEIEKEKTEIL